MEKSKRKHGAINLRRYWLFFVPFTAFMALMVKYPIRITIGDLMDDAILYASITLICLATSVRVYRRAGKQARRLTALILLCTVFAAWQPFDIFVLRSSTRASVSGFGAAWEPYFTDNDGFAYYGQRFYRDQVGCNFASISEHYFGSTYIAITLEIHRNITHMGCGG